MMTNPEVIRWSNKRLTRGNAGFVSLPQAPAVPVRGTREAKDALRSPRANTTVWLWLSVNYLVITVNEGAAGGSGEPLGSGPLAVC
jgi:hypothetical protein